MFTCMYCYLWHTSYQLAPHPTIILCSSHRDYASLILRPHPSRAWVWLQVAYHKFSLQLLYKEQIKHADEVFRTLDTGTCTSCQDLHGGDWCKQLCKDLTERGWMCPGYWLQVHVAILFSCAAQTDEHHEFYQAFHLNEVLQKCWIENTNTPTRLE